ncbi:family 1 glycosylhydrolase [Nocardia inohanensis]|uniref:family 1 glycosylhydrolase n=1 Tax=Nocardia inohanensis TaxID=209246 RepID=UPI00082A0285|nr:family 1 glycosylhydrolase [Nocardia inohanensis]
MHRRAGIAAVALGLAMLSAPPATAAPPGETPVGALPGGFLWGVSGSGFQSEGTSPDSNWSRYAASGKTRDPIGTSVDFLHRYREDITRARELGAGVFRMSVEWARLEPAPGQQDPAAWAFYDEVIDAVRAAGMRPMITLDHWVYPGWAFEQGGWRRAEMSADWLANARRVVDRYARFDPLWITINEPSAYAFQEMQVGGLGPAELPAAMDRWVSVHREIYDYIHTVRPDALVSSNVAYFPVAESAVDTTFLDRIADKLDFLGLDYYYSMSPADLSYANVFSEPWRASAAPDGLYYALRHYAETYPRLPLYVVENGMPTENGATRPDGYQRTDHLADSVYWVQRAVHDGMNVIGYNYWSLTDNYEWGSYTPRFGLYTVDVKNDPSLARVPTPAVDAYRRVIAQGGVPGEYRPVHPATRCSLVDAPASCLRPAG